MGSASPATPMGHEMREHFLFDPNWVNLNHGSFGAFPHSVNTLRLEYQMLLERRPDKFLRWTYSSLLQNSRAAIAKYINVPTSEVVFVANATTGVNIVLRNLKFQPGDAIVYFDSIYGACEKTLAYIAEMTPVELFKVEYDYPIGDEELIKRFREKVKEVRGLGKTVRLGIFDTIVSLPGVRMPFERLTEVCREEGILSCIDGAHGVGQIPLDIGKLDPDFFVSNCHKWLFTPRGSAVFRVPDRNQALIRSSLPTSHGFNPLPNPNQTINNPLPPSSAESPFVHLFDFVATIDMTPYLLVPEALKFRTEVCGGEEAIHKYISSVVYQGGDTIAKILGTEVLDHPDSRLRDCAFANVKLPLTVGEDSAAGEVSKEDIRKVTNWMQASLVTEFDTFIAVIFYRGAWWVRLSGMIYLEQRDFEWAAGVLKQLCSRVREGEFDIVKGVEKLSIV